MIERLKEVIAIKVVLPTHKHQLAQDQSRQQESKGINVYIDKNGKLTLPPEILKKSGIETQTEFILHQTSQGIFLKKRIPSLSKLYVEPTNACNLNCRTCIRNSWDETVGSLDMATYKKLIDNLTGIETLQQINFWGFGEPLLHPQIDEMVSKAKRLGVKTQIITNALLLTQKMAESLISAGLDSIVVSVDGTTEKTNADIRSGSNLSLVKKHIEQLRKLRRKTSHYNPEIGVEFVLMQRNLEELKNIKRLALSLGAGFIIITNLLPYTEELKDDILYANTAGETYYTTRSKWSPEIMLPPMDFRPEVAEKLSDLVGYSDNLSTPQIKLDTAGGYCRFVSEGSAVVAWDGEVSPCIALMHSYSCYIMGREKHFKRYTIGNVARDNINTLMEDQDFNSFRDRVLRFDFPPCTQCGGCEMAESNEEDCFGNPFPVCGDCLWARGVIQCP